MDGNGIIIDLEEQRAIWVKAITQYCRQRRKEDALTRHQLGELTGLDAMQAQKQSLLDNIAYLCSRGTRLTFIDLAVLNVVTFFAGNADGACTLSVPRIARFLARSPDTIARSIAKLEQEGVLLIERRSGASSLLTPWTNPEFGRYRDSLVWVLDAWAPVEHKRPGRKPTKIPHANGAEGISEIPPASVAEGVSKLPPAACAEGIGNTPRKSEKYPPQHVAARIHKESSTTSSVGYARVRARELGITDDELNEFNRLCNFWGRKSGEVVLTPIPPDETDQLLVSELALRKEVKLETAAQLFRELLLTLSKKQREEAQCRTGPARGVGISSFSMYFRKALRRCVDDELLRHAKMEAEARAEMAVQQHRLNVRVAAVNEPKARSANRTGRSSLDDIMAAAFTEEGN